MRYRPGEQIILRPAALPLCSKGRPQPSACSQGVGGGVLTGDNAALAVVVIAAMLSEGCFAASPSPYGSHHATGRNATRAVRTRLPYVQRDTHDEAPCARSATRPAGHASHIAGPTLPSWRAIGRPSPKRPGPQAMQRHLPSSRCCRSPARQLNSFSCFSSAALAAACILDLVPVGAAVGAFALQKAIPPARLGSEPPRHVVTHQRDPYVRSL